jgi:hypothetical protein
MAAGEAELLAEEIDERRARRHGLAHFLAVHRESDGADVFRHGGAAPRILLIGFSITADSGKRGKTRGGGRYVIAGLVQASLGDVDQEGTARADYRNGRDRRNQDQVETATRFATVTLGVRIIH